MPPTQKATITEIYNTLNQLVEAYTAVMMTFSSVVTDMSQLKDEIADLKEFNRSIFTDAVSSAKVWQDVAEAHKQEVIRLKMHVASLEQDCV